MRKPYLLFLFLLLSGRILAQVSPSVPATTHQHNKQVIGYITQWDAWKNVAGLVPQGGYNQLNIDYSQYTILNFSFFGVASDGSLHSGDYRNPNIYQAGAVQNPAPLVDSDIYSSWDMFLLNGELTTEYFISDGDDAYQLGYRNQGSGWTNINTGASGAFPLSVHKSGGALGLIDLAHQKGVKVMASIGGWSMCKHYPELAADANKRAKFIAGCQKLISMGFDGIDLDWEYPNDPGMNIEHYSAADFTNFAVLVEQIRAAIGSTKLITACFSPASAKLQGFDWQRLDRSMNYFNIMTYDYNGGWSNKAGHNAPLYDYPGQEFTGFSIDATVKSLKQLGVNISKVNLGAPFYGRGVITSGTAALNGATTKRSETILPDGPVQTCADYTNWSSAVWQGTPNYSYVLQTTGSGSGWTDHWDDVAKVPYITKGNYFLSYDNPRSISAKAQYIKDNGLAGAIVWHVYGDMVNMTSSTVAKGKLIYCPNTQSPLVNTLNQVFANGSTDTTVTPPPANTGKAVVGYWQNWGATTDNPPYIRLRDIDTRWNVIDIAFATTGGDFATLNFAPANGTVSDFISDIQLLQSQGKKVLLSIGGENGTVLLTGATQKQAFINSLEAIIDQYNFDGFDLDLEGGTTLQLNNGDNNFMSPTTPKVVNLVDACKQVIAHRQAAGKTCWLTMAPETFYVQTAFGSTYSPLVGAYLPIIYGLKDQLTFLAPQYYNTGSVTGLDGKNYNQATPDFTVAMSEMLMTGFPVQGTSQTFPALRQDQVVFGLPATQGAAGGGYYAPASVKQALDYLTKGISFGGGYQLRNASGYPGLRGGMTWSINWDKSGGNAWVTNIYNYFFGNTTGNTAPTVSLTAPATGASFNAPATVTLTANASDADGSVTKVDFFSGSTLLGTATAAPYSFTWRNVAAGSYSLTAIATDNGGATTTSTAVSITVKDTTTGGGGNCSGVAAWNATTAYNGGAQVVYNNSLYSAKWWTQGEQPDINTGDGKPWQLVNACSGPTGNKAPAVNITAPATGASVTAPATINIQVSATDSDGTIAKVDFFNGSTLLGTATSAPYTFSWTGVVAGSYTLKAVATDNSGAATTSALVSLTVTGSTGGGGNCAGVPVYQPYPAIYMKGDKVTYNGNLYQSTSDNLYNVTPGTADWWWTPLGSCSASLVNTAQNAQGTKQAIITDSRPLAVYPNPVSGSALQLQVNALAGERLSIDIVSVSGSAPILHSEWVAASAGTQPINLNIGKLPTGIWIVRVKHPVSGKIETTKIIKL